MVKEKFYSKNLPLCPYDTHDKELNCQYYQESDEENYGCFCRFMTCDRCLCPELGKQ